MRRLFQNNEVQGGLVGPTVDVRQVSALVRGISILKAFSPTAQELSGKELADLTGLPKPTLFRMLDTLCEVGLLRYSARVSKYVPGVGLLSLAAPVLARMSIRQFARPMMQELADHINGQIQLVVGCGMNLTYAELVQGVDSKVFRPEVGMHVSLTRTASGRAYLSTLDEAQGGPLVAKLKARDGERADWIQQRLDDARRDLDLHGFCRSHGDLHREVTSIAVPMRKPRDDEYWIFAASLPVFSPHIDRIESDVAPRLIALVRSVEGALGNFG